MNIKMIIPLCVAAVAMRAGAVMVVGDANTTTVVTPSNTIITATQNATFTVTEPGEIEILLVGGGGGAGGSTEKTSGYTSGDSRGGGGGVIHKASFHVEALAAVPADAWTPQPTIMQALSPERLAAEVRRTPTAGPIPAVRLWLPTKTETWVTLAETHSTTRLPAAEEARVLLVQLVLLWVVTDTLATSPAKRFTMAAAVAAVGEILRL